MYVARLDRPWLESPFLFQGFAIESEAELEQLRALCRYVYVEEGGRQAAAPLRHAVTVPTPKAPAPAAPDTDAVRKALRKAVKARLSTRRYLNGVMQDVRLGRSVSTADARAVVGELVESVAANLSAALWLTNLKRKDEYTSIHSLNVCVLSVAFACHLRLPRERIETIGLGALLHDVGKMRTPQALLNKPGRLSSEEFEVLRRHPVDGFEIVSAAGGVPRQALEIIRHHHERLDGRGYPDGLRGEEIGRHVLITAIADIYDAVTSDRAYHRAISPHDGLKVLYRMADGGLGKELVEEFIRCIGIYPVGSVVRLGSGVLAQVVSSRAEERLRPVVSLLRDAGGEPILPRRVVDLAAQPDSEMWRVAEVVDTAAEEIDLTALTAAAAFS